MKWITHQACALTAATSLGLPPVAVAASLVGAVLPDMIDFFRAGRGPKRQKRFNQVHRGASHFWGWYCLALIFFGVASFWPGLWTELLQALAATGLFSRQAVELLHEGGLLAATGLFFGALIHIAGDMLTPSGVPYLPGHWSKRYSLKLFSTGSVQEYLFLAGLCAVYAFFFHDVLLAYL